MAGRQQARLGRHRRPPRDSYPAAAVATAELLLQSPVAKGDEATCGGGGCGIAPAHTTIRATMTGPPMLMLLFLMSWLSPWILPPRSVSAVSTACGWSRVVLESARYRGAAAGTAVRAAAGDSRRPNEHRYYATNDALVWFGCLTRLGSFEILELARDHSKATHDTHALLLSLSHPHSHNPKRLVL
jgi:hypothetical protein